MGTSHGRRLRLGRRDAERLLSGQSSGTDWPELTRVLRAASGPAYADELADESATRAGFSREHRSGGGVAGTRCRPPLLAWRPVLALRLLLVLVVLLSTGFVTGAATGTLPAGLQHRANRLFGAREVRATAPAAGVSGRPSGVRTATPSRGAPGSAPVTAVPSAGRVVGWCHSYQEGRQNPSSKFLAELASAAGGTDKIPSFCAAVLGAAAARNSGTPSAPSARASHSGRPTKTHGPASSRAAGR